MQASKATGAERQEIAFTMRVLCDELGTPALWKEEEECLQINVQLFVTPQPATYQLFLILIFSDRESLLVPPFHLSAEPYPLLVVFEDQRFPNFLDLLTCHLFLRQTAMMSTIEEIDHYASNKPGEETNPGHKRQTHHQVKAYQGS